MKTKELIEELLKLDPEGILDVCVGKSPIIFADILPYYYDGHYWRIVGKYPNEVSAEYPETGNHISLVSISMDDWIFDNIDKPVDCNGNERLENRVAEYRVENQKILDKCQKK